MQRQRFAVLLEALTAHWRNGSSLPMTAEPDPGEACLSQALSTREDWNNSTILQLTDGRFSVFLAHAG